MSTTAATATAVRPSLSRTVLGTGPGLVLAHGAGGSFAANYGPIADELARHHTVVGVDYPGTGNTPRATAPIDLDELADQLVAAADAEGLDTFALAGFSLGGPVAIRAAARHPERVTALVLTATFAHADARLGLGASVWGKLHANGDDRLLAEYLTFVALSTEALNATAPADLTAAIDTLAGVIAPGTPEHTDLVQRADVRADLAGLTVPTLVVVTTLDPLVPPTLQRELAAGIPGARTAEIATGHLPFAERPDEWGALITDFLTGHEGSEGSEDSVATMRAVVQRSAGEPGVLETATVPRPVPLPSEVLVRVRAASINPVDAMVRSGAFPLLGTPPFTLGWDVSGVVEEIVPGVTRFAVGDEVFGMPFFPRAANAYAEYVAVPSRQLARKPASLSHEEAAGLAMAGLTAWHALVDGADVRPGQRVLIHGAGGGVGHLAVQIAKSRGAYVIATAGPGKQEFVRSLGADEVIDYRAVDFTKAVQDVDVVLDAVGGEVGPRSIEVLRTGGVFTTIVDRANTELRDAVTAAGLRFVGVTVEPDAVALEALAALADAGLLRVHVEHILPLDDAARAHELIESGRTQGKIVLSV